MARNTYLPFRRPAPPAGHPAGTSSTLQHAPCTPPIPRGGVAGGAAPSSGPPASHRRSTAAASARLPRSPGTERPFPATRTGHPHQKGLRCRSPSFSSTASPPSTPWAPTRCPSAFPAPRPSWSPSGPARSATTPDPSRSPPTAPWPTYRTPRSSWSPAGPASPRRWTTRPARLAARRRRLQHLDRVRVHGLAAARGGRTAPRTPGRLPLAGARPPRAVRRRGNRGTGGHRRQVRHRGRRLLRHRHRAHPARPSRRRRARAGRPAAHRVRPAPRPTTRARRARPPRTSSRSSGRRAGSS